MPENTGDPITQETTNPTIVIPNGGVLGKYLVLVLTGGSVSAGVVGSVDWFGVHAIEERVGDLEDQIAASIAREHADRVGLATVVDDVGTLKRNVFQLCLKAGADCSQ